MSVIESLMMISMAGLQVFVVRFFFQGARKGMFSHFYFWGVGLGVAFGVFEKCAADNRQVTCDENEYKCGMRLRLIDGLIWKWCLSFVHLAA